MAVAQKRLPKALYFLKGWRKSAPLGFTVLTSQTHEATSSAAAVALSDSMQTSSILCASTKPEARCKPGGRGCTMVQQSPKNNLQTRQPVLYLVYMCKHQILNIIQELTSERILTICLKWLLFGISPSELTVGPNLHRPSSNDP